MIITTWDFINSLYLDSHLSSDNRKKFFYIEYVSWVLNFDIIHFKYTNHAQNWSLNSVCKLIYFHINLSHCSLYFYPNMMFWKSCFYDPILFLPLKLFCFWGFYLKLCLIYWVLHSYSFQLIHFQIKS